MRLNSICRREFEMDMKNIGNPLTMEQLRKMSAEGVRA